jgi:branched-chain amino acid transport system permease protein
VSTPSVDIASPAAARRTAPRLSGLWVLLGLLLAMALMPVVASPYAIILMLPFMGYGIALLGFNLLF